MTKTQIILTNKQFSESVSSLLEGKKIIKTIHPADNMLFLTLENNVTIYVTGHWEYHTKNKKIVSSILENESVEDNFSKIEDLAEKLSLEKPTIDKVTVNAKNKINITFTNQNKLDVSIYITEENKNEILDLSYSSLDDTTHIHYHFENESWQQSIMFKQ